MRSSAYKDWEKYGGIVVKDYSVFFDSSSGSWALFKGRKPVAVSPSTGFIETLMGFKVPAEIAKELAAGFVELLSD